MPKVNWGWGALCKQMREIPMEDGMSSNSKKQILFIVYPFKSTVKLCLAFFDNHINFVLLIIRTYVGSMKYTGITESFVAELMPNANSQI